MLALALVRGEDHGVDRDILGVGAELVPEAGVFAAFSGRLPKVLHSRQQVHLDQEAPLDDHIHQPVQIFPEYICLDPPYFRQSFAYFEVGLRVPCSPSSGSSVVPPALASSSRRET